MLSHFYTESGNHFIRLEGNESLPSGRVTIQGAKFELAKAENNGVEVDDYFGELLLGPYQIHVRNPVHRFFQRGKAPFALTLWSSLFADCKPEFTLGPSAELNVLSCLSTTDTIAPSILDTSRVIAVSRLPHALDDLRRLGALDLRMTATD